MHTSESRRLIVLGHRLPVTVHRSPGELRTEQSTGGLVAAMEPAMRQRGGAWIGRPGLNLRPEERLEVAESSYQPCSITLSDVDADAVETMLCWTADRLAGSSIRAVSSDGARS